jgi:hypothetical protein
MTTTDETAQKIKRDPLARFDAPMDVVRDDSLTYDQKLEILRSWEYDARELQTAEEENMAGGEHNRLQEVLKAIDCLSEPAPDSGGAPNKQGGSS